MSTPKSPSFSISAKFLGPIFGLEAELTGHRQNMIFARNGTGKSFLSRAFRCLDIHKQGVTIDEAALNLVSDEASDGIGSLSFCQGTKRLGALDLKRKSETAEATVSDSIFHVFSEDFVHEQLRERQYRIDGEIETQIAVSSEKIELDDHQEALREARGRQESYEERLREKFETEKTAELLSKAGVNKQLNEYRALNFEELLSKYQETPRMPESGTSILFGELDRLKAIPSEPKYPMRLNSLQSDDLDISALEVSLEKETSSSSVSEEIKKKIEAHHDFYEVGVEIIKVSGEACPFCEQAIHAPEPKSIIDSYIQYFADVEEKHKAELRAFYKQLQRKQEELSSVEKKLIRQSQLYDELKFFIPSYKETTISNGEKVVASAIRAIEALQNAIKLKAEDLRSARPIIDINLAAELQAVRALIEDNNRRAASLQQAVEKSDDERRKLQRIACEVFECEFVIRNWQEFEGLRQLNDVVKAKEEELSLLEKSGPTANARDRVAETFHLLLQSFFDGKYLFDKETFVLRRGQNEMVRGPHRTLSDGEKTVIAFCYFIACTHLKVEADSDYEKLFFVFDDPVTSMSYDFVFSIAQTLKNLSISPRGEISINSAQINNVGFQRPSLLLLTHSSYFLNICRTNRVLKPDATFSLGEFDGRHKLVPVNNYLAPFEQQLKHVWNVANGGHPDYSTGNAIRSVLEAIGRFCRPDQDSLQNFLTFLAGEEGFSLKSILINSLCHGTYYGETPHLDDVKLACEEALMVVDRFAPGQLELVKS